MIAADILLLRVTEDARLQLLLTCGCRAGPYAACLCAALLPAEIIDSCSKVSYSGGENKVALPSNFWQRIAENLQESFLEISKEDSWDILVSINKLSRRTLSA